MVSKAKQIILSVSIAIVFALFIGYGISTFYKAPKYEDFCSPELMNKMWGTQAECETVGGQWTTNTYVCPPDSAKPCEPGYCDPSFTCRKGFDAKTNIYDRNVFVICLILGLSAIITGGIFLGVESVGSGLMGGGVLTVIYGTIRYWGQAPDLLRFSILGIVLAVLVWIGYRKLNPEFAEHKAAKVHEDKKPKRDKMARK
jgi:hypothetical protein